MILIMIGWTFFGSETLNIAIQYLMIMFGVSGNQLVDSTALYYLYTNIKLLIILCVCSTPVISKIFNYIINKGKNKGIVVAVTINILIIMLSIAYLVNETYNPFLYFRF